ncbi:MAG: hypothetical protein QOH71_1732 [Blastocatellia bacterium]|jgi:hypothetical protein|nr:hypothetical protein [Blastocatellia bacterium]
MSTRTDHQRLLTIAALLLLMYGVAVSGQHEHRKPSKPAKDAVAKSVSVDAVERAISTICRERVRDSAGTQPIDEMAFQPSLPITDSRVIAGTARARTLLPVAKRLVPFALTKIASRENLEPLNLKWIVERARAVSFIKPDVSEHDNAVWRPSAPDTITIGTVFLAGLRSDEAMIAVLAHELTHAIDGNDHALQPVFARIADKTSVDGFGAHGSATEITCELVAIEVVRDLISQTPSQGKTSRRLARAFQKDCVQTDLADDAHLSPRNMMRTLLSLEPNISAAFARNTLAKETKQRKAVRGISHRKRAKRIRTRA